MAQAIKSNPITPADTLRDLLARSEGRVVNPLEGGGVPELFGWMDEIAALWPGLERSGVDLRGERTRWETLQAQVRRRGGALLRAWPASRPLAAERVARAPAAGWWWELDRLVAADQRRRLLRFVAAVAAVVVAGVAAVVILSRLFPVDPQVREAQRYQFEVEQALAAGDRATAQGLLEQAVQAIPGDAGFQLLLGAAYAASSDMDAAEEQWAIGRSLLPDEAEFLVERSRAFLQLGRAEEALRDAQAAVQLQPDSAPAHLYRAAALEELGDLAQAIEAYARVAELAAQTDPQLVVLARTRMAALMQMPAQPTPIEVP